MQKHFSIMFLNKHFLRFISLTVSILFFIGIGISGLLYAFQLHGITVLYWGELRGKIQTLNPFSAQTIEEKMLNQLIFGEPLFQYDPYEQKILPGIVENFAAFSPDSLTWIIRFKDTIIFHNNIPLTPEDICFSIELYRRFSTEMYQSYNPQLDKIKEITTAGPRIVEITLRDKIDNLPLLLADIPIISQSYFDGGKFAQTIKNLNEKRPVGFGPFQVITFSEDSILLERYPKYYAGTPEFDRICVKLYEKPDILRSDFIKDKLDCIQINEFSDFREISRADTSFSLISVPAPFYTVYSLVLNINSPLLSSDKIRKAIKTALNKSLYPISNVQFNVRSVAYGPLPETSWAFFKKMLEPVYNPLDSKDELYRQGWIDENGDGILDQGGKPFTLELIYPENDIYLKSLIYYIRFDLNEVGINIVPKPLPPAVHKERVAVKDFQLAIDQSYCYQLDAVRTFFDFFRFFNSVIGRNVPPISEASYTLQLRRIAQIPNQKSAEAIFYRLQDLYLQSNVSIALTYQHHYYYAINKRHILNFIKGNRLAPVILWKPVYKQ